MWLLRSIIKSLIFKINKFEVNHMLVCANLFAFLVFLNACYFNTVNNAVLISAISSVAAITFTIVTIIEKTTKNKMIYLYTSMLILFANVVLLSYYSLNKG